MRQRSLRTPTNDPASGRGGARPGSGRPAGRAGFTVVELTVSLALIGIISTFTVRGLKKYAELQRARSIQESLQGTLATARTAAVRAGQPVIVYVDRSNRYITLRNGQTGATIRRAYFNTGSQTRTETLTLNAPGDSLVFSSRGFCLNCSLNGATTVAFTAGGHQATVHITMLGRLEADRMVAIR